MPQLDWQASRRPPDRRLAKHVHRREEDDTGLYQPLLSLLIVAHRCWPDIVSGRSTTRREWTATRQTILTSVLESLRLYLKTFTLASVLEEIKRWWAAGRSCFTERLEKLKVAPPEQSVIDRVLPSPSG